MPHICIDNMPSRTLNSDLLYSKKLKYAFNNFDHNQKTWVPKSFYTLVAPLDASNILWLHGLVIFSMYSYSDPVDSS